METLYYSKLESPVGALYVGVSEKGMVLLDLHGGEFLRKPSLNGHRGAKVQWVESEKKTAAYVAELKEYFAGRRKKFSLPLDLRGTELQKRRWHALHKNTSAKSCPYVDMCKTV